MNATVIAKYSSESLGRISIESLERVFPLEVRGVVSRRFKVGNTAGEYTGCGSSPHTDDDIQKFLGGAVDSDEVKNAKLNDIEKNKLDRDLHITELDNAILQSNLKSAPGLDFQICKKMPRNRPTN
jgi:hypothetical protein